MPVRLAPSLGGKPELADEVAVRGGATGSPQTVRPNDFTGLRNTLFPSFHSIHAEPDKHAWEQAAPHFGLRDGKATTLLAPDARVPLSHSVSALLPRVNPGAVFRPQNAASSLSPVTPPSPSSFGQNPFAHSFRPGFGQSASAGSYPGPGNFTAGNHTVTSSLGATLPRTFPTSFPGTASLRGGVSSAPSAAPVFGSYSPSSTHSSSHLSTPIYTDRPNSPRPGHSQTPLPDAFTPVPSV